LNSNSSPVLSILSVGPHSYVHVVPFSVKPFVKSYPRVPFVVCGLVGGGVTVVVVETESTLPLVLTPNMEKAKRPIVTATES